MIAVLKEVRRFSGTHAMHHRSLFDIAFAAIGMTPAALSPPGNYQSDRQIRRNPDDDWLDGNWIAASEPQFGDGAEAE
ncbi:MAG: hypothetical protein PHT60_04470 [Acidiphilium sp.]|nr:hypothetical protein [Acidiphilium sp.]MDD4935015.1 hypothetical protein [Acidiphilium sp.]